MPLPLGKFVLPRGTNDAKVFIMGRNPGFQESKKAIAFVGKAGEELNMYCTQAGIDQNSLYISNLYRYFTADDEPPTTSQFDFHWSIAERELLLVKPKVLVTLGSDCRSEEHTSE